MGMLGRCTDAIVLLLTRDRMKHVLAGERVALGSMGRGAL